MSTLYPILSHTAARTASVFGMSLLDDAAASDARTTLGLGTMATAAAADYLPKAGGTMTGAIDGVTALNAAQFIASYAVRSDHFNSSANGYTAIHINPNTGITTVWGVGSPVLHVDSALVEQRNGTNAQTLRVYGTYTDASNYVCASLASSSTAVTLSAQTAGTGADDVNLNLTPAGLGRIVATSPLSLKGYTVSTLPAGTQGDTAYVTDALAPVFLATIAGGGAVVTTVFYNGSNWIVQ